MTSYGLKEAAVYFGLTPEDGAGRTYLEGDKIAGAFRTDRARFRAYLEDDLRETAGSGRRPPADLLRAGAGLSRCSCRRPRSAGRPPRSTCCCLRNTTPPGRPARCRRKSRRSKAATRAASRRGSSATSCTTTSPRCIRACCCTSAAIRGATRWASSSRCSVRCGITGSKYKQLARTAPDRGGAFRGPGPAGGLQDPDQLVLRLSRLLRRALRRRRARRRGHAEGPGAAPGADRGIRGARAARSWRRTPTASTFRRSAISPIPTALLRLVAADPAGGDRARVRRALSGDVLLQGQELRPLRRRADHPARERPALARASSRTCSG